MTTRSWSAEELRSRFERAAAFTWQPGWPRASTSIESAVLIPFVTEESGTSVLFTRRTDHLNHHAGQVSFPGGRRDPSDASLIETALRETAEEVGLEPASIEILGTLPGFHTPSGFSITPVTALVEAPLSLRLDPHEVAEAFLVPLHHLADPRNYQHHRIRFHGGERTVFAIPHRGRFIWGATAGILSMLVQFLQS